MIRKWSIRIILIITIFCVFWDVYAFLSEKNSTFSVIITDWAFYTPWIPFAFGVLMGHWFAAPMGSKYEHVDKK
jgi:hypothetical protein